MQLSPRPRLQWKLRTRTLALGDRTLLMGIVNATPDSFSDGGMFTSLDHAVAYAVSLLDAGAAILDIGGESTRPGAPAMTAEAISAEEEQARVLPLIGGILQQRPRAILSVDTYRSTTARLAIDAGAEIVNEVSGGLWDSDMFKTCAFCGCGMVVMHTRGLPSEWEHQQPISPAGLLPDILHSLRVRVLAAERDGVEHDRIALDPGFGFGKRGAENWALLSRLERMHELGWPLVVGISRKGFLSELPANERDADTHAALVAAVLSGAHILRVHDVAGAVRASAVADMLLMASAAS